MTKEILLDIFNKQDDLAMVYYLEGYYFISGKTMYLCFSGRTVIKLFSLFHYKHIDYDKNKYFQKIITKDSDWYNNVINIILDNAYDWYYGIDETISDFRKHNIIDNYGNWEDLNNEMLKDINKVIFGYSYLDNDTKEDKNVFLIINTEGEK